MCPLAGVAELADARDLKSLDTMCRTGSSPVSGTNKKGTFVHQKFLFCLSKPQAWHIIAARSAVYIIKGGEPPLYLITRQRVFSCGLMIYNTTC